MMSDCWQSVIRVWRGSTMRRLSSCWSRHRARCASSSGIRHVSWTRWRHALTRRAAPRDGHPNSNRRTLKYNIIVLDWNTCDGCLIQPLCYLVCCVVIAMVVVVYYIHIKIITINQYVLVVYLVLVELWMFFWLENSLLEIVFVYCLKRQNCIWQLFSCIWI